MSKLTLVSHHLCPYVQRAAISLSEKAVPFERIYVDLSNKPDWFRRLSPLGKVPVLRVRTGGREEAIFESAVILEYLEETQPRPLHPGDPLQRARHRGWIEFGSSVLNRIAAFYNARTEAALAGEACALSEMFGKIEAELGEGPWFDGAEFSLVDTAYGPIFRYFDVFEQIGDFVSFDAFPKLSAWRSELARRTSIREAVTPDYPERLLIFLKNRESALGARVRATHAMSS